MAAAPARGDAGQRLPADQPGRGLARRSSGSRRESARPRALPLPRRLRLRGRARGAARAAVLRVGRARPAPCSGRRASGDARRSATAARPARPSSAGACRTSDGRARAVAIGRYGEERTIYRAPAVPTPRRPPAHAPHGGRPVRAARARRCSRRSTASSSGARTATGPVDYGGLVLRASRPTTACRSGRSTATSIPSRSRSAGDAVARATQIARLGDAGGQRRLGAAPAPPAVHRPRDSATDVPGVALPDEADLWESICPDPNLLLGRPGGDAAARAPRPRTSRARRRGDLSRALSSPTASRCTSSAARAPTSTTPTGARTSTSSTTSPTSATATRAWSRRARGRWRVLNTNTRYLHGSIVDYARRLAATLPDPLRVVLLRQLRLGGERPRAAARARAHRPRRRARARPRLPRPPQLARSR